MTAVTAKVLVVTSAAAVVAVIMLNVTAATFPQFSQSYHGEGPYLDLLLIESSYYRFHIYDTIKTLY